MARLGDVVKQIRGVSYKPEDVYDSLTKDSITLLRANNIQDGKLVYDDVIYVSRKRVQEEQYLKKGDILICTSSGSKALVGKAAYVDYDMLATFGAFCKVVRPMKVYPPYLGHFFNSPYYRKLISDSAAGANINNIRNEHIDEIHLLIPEIQIQKQISLVLDKVTSLIALRKQQLAKLDELVKARFVEMFGDPVANPTRWQKKRFDAICENLDSRRIPITASERKAGIYPYYGASGIVDYVDGYIFDEDMLLISEDGANLIARVTPIAFSVSGKVWVNNHAHVVRFSDICTQKYVEYYFSMIDISNYISGTAQPKLNQSKLNSMLIPIPKIELQKEFLEFCNQIDKEILTIQQGLDILEVLKASLMQDFFR